MQEKIIKAVEYASSSNQLENNKLSSNELDQIIEDIKYSRTDESFLYSVVELVKKDKKKDKEEGPVNVKVRK